MAQTAVQQHARRRRCRRRRDYGNVPHGTLVGRVGLRSERATKSAKPSSIAHAFLLSSIRNFVECSVFMGKSEREPVLVYVAVEPSDSGSNSARSTTGIHGQSKSDDDTKTPLREHKRHPKQIQKEGNQTTNHMHQGLARSRKLYPHATVSVYYLLTSLTW